MVVERALRSDALTDISHSSKQMSFYAQKRLFYIELLVFLSLSLGVVLFLQARGDDARSITLGIAGLWAVLSIRL